MRPTATAIMLTLSVSPAAALDVWVGTTTRPGGRSDGVYHLTLDADSGRLSPARLVAPAREPGFLARHPKLPVLYGTTDRGVTACRIADGQDGKSLEPLGEPRATGDGGPCHVSVDRTGRVLLTAQYGGGSVASYRLNTDGSIAARVSLHKHQGASGVVPERQEAPHAHWAGVSPDNRAVLVPDLGGDRVYVYGLDAATAELTPAGAIDTPAGGGPRHLAFHPTLPVGYVVNELSMAVSVFDWQADGNTGTVRQTVPTLTDRQRDTQTANTASEVRVHPTGRFVYVANRGHDSIAAFAADPATGELTRVEIEACRGAHPRNFAIDPTGRWLVAAGRDSHTLAAFAIDQETGALRFTLQSEYAPSPICVVIE